MRPWSEQSAVLGLSYFFTSLNPASPYGRAQLTRLVPYVPGEEALLEEELLAVGLFVTLLESSASDARLAKVRHHLAQIPDWREQFNRVAAGGTLSDAELFTLKQNLFFFADIKNLLAEEPTLVADFAPPDFSALMALLDPEKTGSPSFYLSDAYSPRLAVIRRNIRDERKEATRLSLTLQEEAARTVALAFNFSGEVTVPRREVKVIAGLEESGLFALSRETYTDLSYTRKPTAQEVAKAAHIETQKRLEHEEEEKVRRQLAEDIRPSLPLLGQAMARLGRLDLTLSKALLARRWRGTRPSIVSGDRPLQFSMTAARHPEVEAALRAEGLEFTPIGVTLTRGVTVITGANMGGKTVALGTVGLLAALAAYGMYVPAEACRTSLFQGITLLTGEYRPGASGLSRFGQEIVNLNQSLPAGQSRSLLLIDEFAASTNPREGSALAQALVEHLDQTESITMLTTHYERLARLGAVAHWQVVGLSRVPSAVLALALAAAGSDAINHLSQLMDYRLFRVEPSEAHSREALRVARFLGLPESIVERALSLLQVKGEE